MIEKEEDPELAAKRDKFKQSTVTLTDYVNQRSNFHSLEQHKEIIPLFVAQLGDEFVLRVKEDVGGVILTKYKRYTGQQLAHSNFNGKISYSEEHSITDKQGRSKTKNVDINVKPYELVSSQEFQANMAYFDSMSLVSSSPGVLQMFIPPRINDATDEMKQWMNSMAKDIVEMFTNLVDPLCLPSWNEELYSIAYKVQHPHEFVTKFFIHYGDGDNGKSLWCKLLSMMFLGYSNVGISDEQADGKFTGYLEDYLLEWFEEIENSNYQNERFEKFIKRLTTETVSFEKKGVDPHAGLFRALIGMNTNQPDLYGLVRSKKATRSRLVAVYFSKGMSQEQWQSKLSRFGIERGNRNKYKNQFIVGASLWAYFESMEIPKTFYPDRYNGEDRDKLFEKLRAFRASGPDKFLNWLNSQNQHIKHGIEGRKGDRKGKKYTQIQRSALQYMFDKYIQKATGIQSNLSLETVTKRMEELGFRLIKPHNAYTYDIDEDLWNNYLSNYEPEAIDDKDAEDDASARDELDDLYGSTNTKNEYDHGVDDA